MYLLIGDCGDAYADDPRGAAFLAYDCGNERYSGVVSCGGTDMDVTVTFRYGDLDGYYQRDIYLIVESVAAGLTGDNSIRVPLTEADGWCSLLAGPYEFDVTVDGQYGVLTIERPNYVERCQFKPGCGPDSDPYECVCRDAIMHFEVEDEYYGLRRGIDRACLQDFYEDGEFVCRGWKFDFLASNNQSVLYGLEVRVCIHEFPDEPLLFTLSVLKPDDAYVVYYTPPSVEPQCKDYEHPDANMNATWVIVVDGRTITLSICGDLHVEQFGCCRCWTRCLCVTWFGSNDFGSEVVCADGYDEPVWGLPFGQLRLDCDCDNLPVLVFTPDDPYEEEQQQRVDCPRLNVAGLPFVEPSFAYQDKQIIVSPRPCKADCVGTALCCGREIPRTLYLEIVIDPEDAYYCDFCDLHFMVTLHYTGQSQADPATGQWEGELAFTCGDRPPNLHHFTLRCKAAGALMSLNIMAEAGECSFTESWIATEKEPDVLVCDPLYAEWSWGTTATPCCTVNPEFPSIHGKMYLTE